jgi:hypothetical protein
MFGGSCFNRLMFEPVGPIFCAGTRITARSERDAYKIVLSRPHVSGFNQVKVGTELRRGKRVPIDN